MVLRGVQIMGEETSLFCHREERLRWRSRFLSLKKLKSKLDRVKNLGLPRKRNHELAMTPCPVTPAIFKPGSILLGKAWIPD